MHKRIVKVLATVLVLVMSVCLFAACGEQGISAGNEPTMAPGYNVKVIDTFGNPVTKGVIVRFLQNGQPVNMQPVDENGIVNKDLAKGDYTVDLQFTGDEAYNYDKTDLTLTADKTYLEIVLYNGIEGEPATVFAHSLTGSSMDMPAYNVQLGGTFVELVAGERNYFLFTPTEAGLYAFSVQNSDAVLGYYGISHVVQDQTLSQPVNGIIEVNIKQQMVGDGGANVLVFGLDATGNDTTAIFCVERVSEALTDEEDVPFEIYKAKTEPVAYTLPAGTKLVEFDPKAATETYQLVLGDDGYYYLKGENDEQFLVLAKLGKTEQEKAKDFVISGYLPSLEEMATKALICKYFYDENGEFVRKESYNECIMEYAACVDEGTGLYPLTEDLKYIIQMRGDHYGWFEEANTKHGYIFLDENGNPIPGINNEISWLVLCCYAK